MSDFDDYYAFKSICNGGGGFSGGCLPVILAVLVILGLIGRIVG